MKKTKEETPKVLDSKEACSTCWGWGHVLCEGKKYRCGTCCGSGRKQKDSPPKGIWL